MTPGPQRAAPPAADDRPGASACLNLQQLLIPAPDRTVLLRVAGDSMAGAHIHHGDLVVVERHRVPRGGQVVVALLADGFTLKHLVHHQGRWLLRPAHPAFPCLELAEGQLWGVATHVIRHLAPATTPWGKLP